MRSLIGASKGGRVENKILFRYRYSFDRVSKKAVIETKEINENIYIDLDRSGNLVAMTIEHARTQANLPSLSYEQIEAEGTDDHTQPVANSRV